MLDWPVLMIIATLLVGYANGANDNFKGVATLFGAGTMDYRNALGWATVATLAGSLAAVFVAGGLISTFQGRGSVPPELSRSEPFVAAVVFAAALTVMLATKVGMPISTTHSLTGALFGSGIASGQARWSIIRTIVLAWLLTLPTAALLSAGIYSLLHSF